MTRDGTPVGGHKTPLTATRRRPALWTAAALILASLVVLLDLLTPPNFAVSVFAGTPIVLAAFAGKRRVVWAVAGIMILANLAITLSAGIHAPISTTYGPLHNWVWNRLMIMASAVPIAVLADYLVGAWNARDAQAAELAQRAADLEEAHGEIAAREEELFRQNEEMQAQNEELERQGEEMRVSNDELARRERMLERLLDLARALASETTQLTDTDVMERICEAMVQLTDGSAAAILVQEGSDMVVRCHHGLGPRMPQQARYPASQTFAALVMSRLQTGYIDDVSKRPDLLMPASNGGEAYMSVLATPLKVRGRVLGAVELYAREKRVWTADQVTLVESLAAQASVTLEAVDLFAVVQEERRKFETVFRTLPLPVAVAEDARCEHVRINPAASVLLNTSMDANISPFAPPGSPQPRFALLRNGQPVADAGQPIVRSVLHGEQVLNEEYEIILPHNERRSLLLSSAPIYDRRGQVAGAVAVGADITVLKRLQQELEVRRREAEEASVRKTRFLAAVSHDIRTPVNAISLTAELVRRATETPAMREQIPGMVGDLQSNAQALTVLVNDLLDVARFDTGKVEFQDSEFSLAQLVEDEIRQLLPLAQEKKLTLSSEGETAIWLRTDRVKLGRVLANLIGNAIKFTERGSVRVRLAAPPGDGVQISVIDTGIGIAREHMHHIFDEFTQLRNPERDRYKGTGLGLAISRRLMEAIGGAISVESELGTGSCFTVRLPAGLLVPRTLSLADRRAAMVDGKPLAALQVLLVEDHASTRWATAQILSAEGATVAEAQDAATGLRMLASGTFDALLLDMMLPDLDGEEVLRRLQRDRPARLRTVVVLTGDYTPERVERVRALGADEMVAKPIDVARLISILQQARAN